MSDLTNKDAEQDTKIAVIDSTLDNSIRRIEMVHKRVDDTNEEIEKLRERVRKLEKWVWGAGAVITAAITLIGFISAADAKQFNDEKTVGILVQKIRQYQFEQNMIQPNDAIDKALKELELWEQ